MKISVLGISRPRSRFLPKFLSNFVNKTADHENTELLMMISEHEDWNLDVVRLFSEKHGIRFFREDMKVGKNGRHLFFNELVRHAGGDWILHACDDHLFFMDGWDDHLRGLVKQFEMDHKKFNVIVPKFTNAGSCSHLVSRGYLDVLGRMGGCGNIDSWINTVLEGIPQSRIRHSHEHILHDHTADHDVNSPDYFSVSHDVTAGASIPLYGSVEVHADIRSAIDSINRALTEGK